MRWDYPLLDINPEFPGLGNIIFTVIIIIIIVIIVIIVIIIIINFMAPCYGWGSTASMVEPLRGGSLLFTTKFPELSGTHFTDLGRMKGWVDLGATQWFWSRDPWIRSPAPSPKGHCSIGHCFIILFFKFNEVNNIYLIYINVKKWLKNTFGTTL